MFDFFAPSHLIILLAVALIVVGPKDLPRLMHMVGKWAGKARGMANEFKKSFDDMARESELDTLRKEIETLRNPGGSLDVNLNPDAPHMGPLDNSVDIGPEPRAGELKVTDAPPAAPSMNDAAT